VFDDARLHREQVGDRALVGVLAVGEAQGAAPGVVGGAEPVQGIVLAATGNGTLHHALEAAALQAQAEGVAVLRATRCVEGRILPRPGQRLRDAGALTPVKARIALMLDLLAAAAQPPA